MMGEVLNEPSVEVGEPQEGLYFLLVSWRGPLRDAGHLHWVHLSGPMGDDEPEVLHSSLLELALLRLKIELVEAQALQNEACDATVFFEGLREDEDVVEVYAHHALRDFFTYDGHDHKGYPIQEPGTTCTSHLSGPSPQLPKGYEVHQIVYHLHEGLSAQDTFFEFRDL
ncbi:hypothetical protein H0H92_000482 [Tricholoma furcatifolium]|nr:hypothetical protein H0H92_000482 [Tricholoma furcatifolium]